MERMFDTAVLTGDAAGPRGWSQRWCAAERPGGYTAAPPIGDRAADAGEWAGWPPPGGAGAAVAELARAVDDLAAVDCDGEADPGLLEAVAGLQRQLNRLEAQQVRLLDAVERREAYRAEGAVTAASWLRERARLDHAQASRRVHAARRLGRLERLAGLFAAGEVTLAHVTAVTDAAVPGRMQAVAACEDTLAELALRGLPRDVRRAAGRIRDLADADGSDAPPLDERGLDQRRGLELYRTIDGLVGGQFALDQVQGEALHTVVDAYERPDPPGTPPEQRRSARQRRADALADALRVLLDTGQAPTVQGNRPHLVLTCDLGDLLGIDPAAAGPAVQAALEARLDRDQEPRPRDGQELLDAFAQAAGGRLPAAPAPAAPAGRDTPAGPPARDGERPRWTVTDEPRPRLRHTGPLDLERTRQLALQARVQVILTLGPWRVVNVGRWHRRLPAWLRMALELVHRHCRGPSCDRKITWTEAHHVVAWHAEQGETDLNRMVPVCLEHHDMVTTGGWHVDSDPADGVCTWTGPDGQVTHTRAPRR